MSGPLLRTSARWRSAPVPDGFGDETFNGQRSGEIDVPGHLYWSGGVLTIDLDDDSETVYLYQLVLREGTANDVVAFVDPERLVALWDHGVWPAAVRETWQPWIDAQQCR